MRNLAAVISLVILVAGAALTSARAADADTVTAINASSNALDDAFSKGSLYADLPDGPAGDERVDRLLERLPEDADRQLHAGDWILLPAHCRHRVTWTQSDPATVWLAVHF